MHDCASGINQPHLSQSSVAEIVDKECLMERNEMCTYMHKVYRDSN